MVGGINITVANVIVAVVLLGMVVATPLAVWMWNRRTGRFDSVGWPEASDPAAAEPADPPAPPARQPVGASPATDAEARPSGDRADG